MKFFVAEFWSKENRLTGIAETVETETKRLQQLDLFSRKRKFPVLSES